MTNTTPNIPSTSTFTAITERAFAILERVAEYQPEKRVTVLAASKTQSVSRIRAAIAGGVRVFGENFLQEAKTKISELEKHAGIDWHFIGHIQSNKTNAIARMFDWVQTVDRIRVAERLSAARGEADIGAPLNLCVEVNVDGESQKSGLAPDEVGDFVKEIELLPHLSIRGLMAIPAPQDDPDNVRPAFRRLRELFEITITTDATSWDTLSMGMSHDYLVAIEEGATIIRVGTALFGPRVNH